jgi:hypothetical protein
MADLIFSNTEYKADGEGCTNVLVSISTAGLNYLDYIFDLKTKDFKDIKKYTVVYSKDCRDTGGSVGETTLNIAPDYAFGITKKSCIYQTSGAINKYTVQLDGINGNLVSGIKFNTSGASLVTHSFVNTLGVLTFVISTDKTNPSQAFDIEITTTAGFIYSGSLTIVQDITINCGWDGTFASPISFPLTTPATNPPAVVVNSGGKLKVNSLFALANLTPALYKIKICEVDFNDIGYCVENAQFIDCHTTPCVESTLCDPTEDVCNVILEVKKQHEAMIYGLDCCNESKRNLLTHYIRIYCSSEATCL